MVRMESNGGDEWRSSNVQSLVLELTICVVLQKSLTDLMSPF